jgi:hypothetical protein
MRLGPYRFSLPAIGLSLSILLIGLENSLATRNLLYLVNDLINLPASIAFRAIPNCCFQGHNVVGYRTWLARFLFFSLASLWWYLVGLEIDFGLLRRLAARAPLFRLCCVLVSTLLQLLAMGTAAMIVIAIARHPGNRTLDYLAGSLLFLFEIGWLQVIGWRFRQAARVDASFRRQPEVTLRTR